MYDSVGVNLCNTVRNGALHYVLQLMGRVWCYGERLRARYHNHLATLYIWYLYPALQRLTRVWETVRDRLPAGRPIGRRPVSARQGSGGRELGGQGARVGCAHRAEMQARGNGGGDTHLTCVPSRRRCRNFPNLGLEVGVEIRRPEAGAGSQSRIASGIEFSVQYTCRCAIPTLLAALPPQFKQLHARSSCAPATVRCVCVQKGGGAMCALQGARRTGGFERPEADEVHSAGARSPSSAGTPFAVTGGHLALF